MKWNRKMSAAVAAAALVIAVLALVQGRDRIAAGSYRRAGERVRSGMSASLQAKYGKDLSYTLDKFWSCYRGGICSRNDMTDVMERLRRLGAQETISDRDIFDLIGFISRMYSDRLDQHHRRLIDERGD